MEQAQQQHHQVALELLDGPLPAEEDAAVAVAAEMDEAPPEVSTPPANGEEGKEVPDEVVTERLRTLLASSDLQNTTEKMLRKQLEEELGVTLRDKKALIREEVVKYLEACQQGEEEEEGGEGDEEEEEERPAKKRRGSGGSGLGSLLSEPLQAFLGGVQRMPRPQVVKAIWAYIKANNLQDPSNKQRIIVDDKLGTLFTPPITMFNMNKQLSNHVFTSASVVGGSDDEDPSRSPRARKPAAKKKPAKSSSDGTKPLSGFAKPIPLSEDLAAATGQAEMSRGAFMKWLYAYVDEHNLKDPSDKRYALSDDTLKQLSGQKRFLLFGSQKLFGKHFAKQ